MKRQISKAVCRLVKNSPTISSRSRPGGRGICLGLFPSVGRRLGVPLILFWLLGIVPYLAVTQEQNEVEGTPQQAPLTGVTSSSQNPLQIALLHWYNANLTKTFRVGIGPVGIAFDGANIWVAKLYSNNVTKLRASDGKVLGTFTVGSCPCYGVAFDGANIWVANFAANTVSKL